MDGVTHYGDIQYIPVDSTGSPSGLVDLKRVLEVFQEIDAHGEVRTEEQLIFRLNKSGTCFFAFRTNVDTYLIAFCWQPIRTGLTPGYCYMAQEARDILTEHCPVYYQDDLDSLEIMEDIITPPYEISIYYKNDFQEPYVWPVPQRDARFLEYVLEREIPIGVSYIHGTILTRKWRKKY